MPLSAHKQKKDVPFEIVTARPNSPSILAQQRERRRRDLLSQQQALAKKQQDLEPMPPKASLATIQQQLQKQKQLQQLRQQQQSNTEQPIIVQQAKPQQANTTTSTSKTPPKSLQQSVIHSPILLHKNQVPQTVASPARQATPQVPTIVQLSNQDLPARQHQASPSYLVSPRSSSNNSKVPSPQKPTKEERLQHMLRELSQFSLEEKQRLVQAIYSKNVHQDCTSNTWDKFLSQR